MANPEQLERLKQDVEDWNAWRHENWDVYLDLTKADLSRANLSGADLSMANLSGANLSGAKLSEIDANSPHSSHLSGADLSGARLYGAYLSDVLLNDAKLTFADLNGAYLGNANLNNADLSHSSLHNTNLINATLDNTTLSGTRVWRTVFAQVDLRKVKGLATLHHDGPSRVELHSIQLPQDGSALHFLRGAGVPDEWIDDYRAHMMHPIQYHSLFISYSSQDDVLARRFHADLQASGVRCWFAPEDLKIGNKFRQRIDEAIHLQDKLLLLLSKHSIESTWVENETEAALEREDRELREVLFPVRLDDTVMQTSAAWAATLRRTRHIGDFTRWADPLAYQSAFDRLLRDLKQN